MDDLYLDTILDLYKHPHHAGWLAEDSVYTRKSASAINASCGDHFEVALHIQDHIIKDAKWRGQGCAISSAAMDQVCGWMIGKDVSALQSLSKETILKLIGLETIITAREKCAFLSLHLRFIDV